MSRLPKELVLLVAPCALLGLLLPPPAFGQGIEINGAPPEQNVDSNDVDLVSATLRVSNTVLVGGDPRRPMSVALNITSPTSETAFHQFAATDLSIYGYMGGGAQTPIGTIGNFASPIGNGMFGACCLPSPNPPYQLGPIGPARGIIATTAAHAYLYSGHRG